MYRAETVDGQETVAVKLLRDRWAADPASVASFKREARICQRFKHPNIVPIYDVGSEDDFHYFTMEFVEGGNLRDFCAFTGRFPRMSVFSCIYEICLGLEYALEKGASHRDLKLTNVLMSSQGVARLVDFGLAGGELPTQGGTSEDVHRALEYAALERGTNAPTNDLRSDIFFSARSCTSFCAENLRGRGRVTRGTQTAESVHKYTAHHQHQSESPAQRRQYPLKE